MKFRLKINLLASWGDHVIGLLIGLFLMPFVLNTAGDEQYGLWLFICSIAGYSGLMNLGFGETISRFVAHHHEKNDITQINRVVNVIGAIYLGMSGLVLAIAGIVAWLAPSFYHGSIISISELRTVILLLGANVAVGMTGSVFGGIITGLQRFDLERGFRSVAGIVRLVLTVVLLQEEHALSTLATVFLITTLAENAGYLSVVFRQLPGLKFGTRFLYRETLNECFAFSMFAFLDALSEKLIDATDTIIIGAFFGTKYIVPYYVAHRLTTFSDDVYCAADATDWCCCDAAGSSAESRRARRARTDSRSKSRRVFVPDRGSVFHRGLVLRQQRARGVDRTQLWRESHDSAGAACLAGHRDADGCTAASAVRNGQSRSAVSALPG